MTHVYLAEGGDEYERDNLGIYTDLEVAWTAALAASPNGASVTQFELDRPGYGECLRWRTWSNHENAVVTVTAEDMQAQRQAAAERNG